MKEGAEMESTVRSTMRACTVNLVAAFETERALEEALPGLRVLGEIHPARFLLLLADEKAPAGAAQTWSVAPPGARAPYMTVVRAREVRHLASAFNALSEPELPMVVYWTAELSGARFDRMLAAADRLILDSGTRPARELGRLLPLLNSGAPLGDLAWARIAPWQAVAADVLDLPNLREHRARVKSAEIHFAPSADGPGAEAALLGGWLASRLSGVRVTFAAETTGSATASATPGALTGLMLDAPPARFSFRAEKNLICADVTGDDDGPTSHWGTLHPAELGRLLAYELQLFAGRDEVYEFALRAAAKLV